MTKTIKLDDVVYQQLDQFRGKHETFGGAVKRLLDIRDGVDSLTMTMEGMRSYAEFRAAKLIKATPADGPGDSAEVSDVRSG